MAEQPIDPLAIAYFSKEFRLAFLTKKMDEFEDWFVELMGIAHGEDFEPVRAYGRSGDLKCDGRHLPLGRLHQCYAPVSIRATETIAKIDRDFHGAREHWPEFMKIWCFVFNDVGLPPTVTQHLDKLRRDHPDIQIVTWGETALRNIVMNMGIEKLTLLFGPPITLPVFDSVQFTDLKPVVEALAEAEPDADDVPIDAPSVDKLEHNNLSPAVADFLKIGRRKESKVEQYMATMLHPDAPEKIAEALRKRYAELRTVLSEPDMIFSNLERFIGTYSQPKEKAAALAVMSYFFERCDIFEDAGGGAPA